MTAPGSAAAVRQRSPSSPAAPAPINTRDAQWTAAALQRKTSRARAHTPVQGEGKAGSRFIRVVAASSSSSSSSSSSKVTWKKKNPQATWQQSASQSDIPAVTSQHAHPQTGAGCSARAARTMEITSSPPSTASVACGIAILLGSRALAEAEAHARPRPVPLQLATSLPLTRSLARSSSSGRSSPSSPAACQRYLPPLRAPPARRPPPASPAPVTTTGGGSRGDGKRPSPSHFYGEGFFFSPEASWQAEQLGLKLGFAKLTDKCREPVGPHQFAGFSRGLVLRLRWFWIG